VTADFSITTNPCGVGTYGYTKSFGSTPLIVYGGTPITVVVTQN
jgi:hypothetical protein